MSINYSGITRHMVLPKTNMYMPFYFANSTTAAINRCLNNYALFDHITIISITI